VPPAVHHLAHGDPGHHGAEFFAQAFSVIAGAKARRKAHWRFLIRESGTEPLIRVMAECEDEALLIAVAGGIVRAARTTARAT
jgi:phosphoglucosamine mutase